MNRHTAAPLLFAFLMLANPVASPQDLAHREKVAEGEYSEWQDGHLLKDTGLTWIVWRMNDGLKVEATLPPDKDAFLAAELAGPGFRARFNPRRQNRRRPERSGGSLAFTQAECQVLRAGICP